MREYSVKHAIYLGVFHSVSAFCTAGFSLFSDNLCAYRDSIVINVMVDILCIVGGIGFFVIYDVYNYFFVKTPSGEPPKKLLTHSKLVLVMLPTLLIIGMSLIYISEWSVILPLSKDKVLTSVFHAVSASTTTGFNTMDAGTMK
ncbi:MAG: potassium transporter TrkG, partial [Planctomycetota bacterium]